MAARRVPTLFLAPPSDSDAALAVERAVIGLTRAGRGGAGVNEALGQMAAGGTVVSRHQRVLNIAAEGGRLLALQASEIPLTPFGLIVEPVPLVWPAEGTPARRVGERLFAGALTVDLATRQTVAPALPRASLSVRDAAAATAVLAPFAQHSAFGSWWIKGVPSHDPLHAALQDRARRSITGLMRALQAAPRAPTAVVAAARSLMGLGPGGTPSGDDLLEGLLAAWLVFGPERAAAWSVTADLADLAETLTTRLAAEFYYHLRHGRVSEQLHELLMALATRETGHIATAAAEIGRFGATSGWDTVAGVHAYLLASEPRGLTIVPATQT